MSVPKRLAVIEAGSKGIRLLVVRRRESPPGMDVLESRGEVGNLGEALGRNAGRMRRTTSGPACCMSAGSSAWPAAAMPIASSWSAPRSSAGPPTFNEFRDSLPEPLALRVLAPEEEAVGSFFAACWGLRRELAQDRRLLVIDLGGGSMEVVAGRAGSPPSPEACVSLRTMGTLALREAWHHAPNPDEREHRFSQYIESQIDRHRPHFRAFRAFGRTGPVHARADRRGTRLDGHQLGLAALGRPAESIQVEIRQRHASGMEAVAAAACPVVEAHRRGLDRIIRAPARDPRPAGAPARPGRATGGPRRAGGPGPHRLRDRTCGSGWPLRSSMASR